MPSGFKSNAVFSSGPHRFNVGPTGSDVQPNSRLSPLTPGSTVIGPLEVRVEVRGHLVAGSETALWALRDAIQALLTDPPQVGTLEDQSGRQWTSMTFVRLEYEPQTDRGRQRSIGYTATFLRLLTLA